MIPSRKLKYEKNKSIEKNFKINEPANVNYDRSRSEVTA